MRARFAATGERSGPSSWRSTSASSLRARRTCHPASRRAAGHAHRTIEEIYLVLEGEVTLKLDDEIVSLGRHDAVLIPPETVRMARGGHPKAITGCAGSTKAAAPAPTQPAHRLEPTRPPLYG